MGFGDYLARLLTGVGRSAEEAAPARTARVYRGAPGPEQWPPTSPVNDTFWASSDPEVANTFAGNYHAMGDVDHPANITPAEVRFQNPLVIDAGGREWDNIPFGGKRYTSDAFASLARRRGYDGLVLRNVQDDGPLATSYAAVKPGTVFSPLTGERLYASAPIAAGAAGLAGNPSQSEAATMPTNDDVVTAMLGQPQQDDFYDNLPKFKALVEQTHPAQAPSPQLQPQEGGPAAQPSEFDRHMQNITDFWAKQPPPPQPPQAELRGRGPGESRDPQATRPADYLQPAYQGAADIMANTGLGLPGIPGLNKLAGVVSNPRIMGPVAAGVGMLAGIPGASTAGDSPLAQLRAQRQALEPQLQAAWSRREENARNPGPKFKQADADWQALKAEADKADQAISNFPNTPEGMRLTQEENDRVAAAEADRKAHEPFGEAHPYINESLPLARYAIAAGIPFAGKGIGAWLSTRPASMAGRIDSAMTMGRNALAGTATPLEQEGAGRMLSEYAGREPGPFKTGAKEVGKVLGAAAVGGSAGAELTGLPDQYDAKILKAGSPEQRAADERMRDPETYKWPAIFGVAAGIGGLKAGDKLFTARQPDYAGAKGMSDTLLGTKRNALSGAAPAPAASQIVLPSPQMPPLSGPPPSAQPAQNALAGPSPGKKIIGGTHPDHDWDEKSQRWKDVRGRYLTGEAPK